MLSALQQMRLRTGLRLRLRFFIKLQCMKFKAKFVTSLLKLVPLLNNSGSSLECQRFGVGNCLNMDNSSNVS